MIRSTINIEAVEPKEYNTIEYVNLETTLKGQPEILKEAYKYFSGMTTIKVPGEVGLNVYFHDWQSFVRKYMWDIQNYNISNTNDI